MSDCGHLLLNVAKTIPRAKFLRFRPAEAGFHDSVMDLKAQLEYSLRRMTVLTIGDVIPVSLYGRRVPLEVMDVKPECKAQVRLHCPPCREPQG